MRLFKSTHKPYKTRDFLLIGEAQSGKKSLLTCLKDHVFIDNFYANKEIYLYEHPFYSPHSKQHVRVRFHLSGENHLVRSISHDKNYDAILIAIDLSNTNCHQMAEKIIDQSEIFFPHCPIVVVGTKNDECESSREVEKLIESKNIPFVITSAKQNFGFKELEKTILVCCDKTLSTTNRCVLL